MYRAADATSLPDIFDQIQGHLMEYEHTHNHKMQSGAPNSGTSPAGHHAHQAGHDRHAGHSVAMFRDKFWLSLALTLPVVFWSSEVQHWLGYTAPTFPGSRFIPAILGTVIFVYGGGVFIQGAWHELSRREPGMMTLISLTGRGKIGCWDIFLSSSHHLGY